MTPLRSDALAGKRILITGGGSGLGRGMAAHFAALGAEVHLWGRRRNVLDEAAVEIGERAHPQVVDIREPEQVDRGVQEIFDAHGPLTGLVNIPKFRNCGVGENLDPIFNAAIAGPRNFNLLTQGAVCFVIGGFGCSPKTGEPVIPKPLRKVIG